MGKSTVSTMLSQLNNPIHDADKTVHELMSVNGKAYYEIAESFPGAIQVNGVDTFKWNEEGKFTEMKVLLRPQKSLDLIQQEMEKNLLNPEIWR